MAKGKKNAELSLEERLEAALVPNWEQPYKAPENWCWVKQGAVSVFLNGRAYKQSELLDDDTAVPVLRVGNLFTNCYWYYSDLKLEDSKYLDNNDLIYAWSASFGPFIWNGGKVIYHYHIWKVIPSSALLKKYYYFWLMNDTERLKKQGHGTGMLHVTKEMMELAVMPLPPIYEQKRIVDRIESLFAKLDEAKEKAQAVVDGYEDRKAAILHKAFTGELTRTWSERQGKPLDTWKTKRFNEVAEVKSNLVDPADYPDHPHIAPDNIEKKTGKLLDYHTIAEDAVKSGKHRFFAGQILYSKIRPNLSKVVVVDFDGLCSADMYPIEPKEGVNTRFLWYYMLSEDFVLQASTAGSRSVLPKINQKELSSLKVQITELEEQEKVVAVLDGLFKKEQRAKEAAEQVVEQIDGIKKSILARAFRGELGTNDPNDESAIELLKKVLQEENPEPKQIRRITIPKDLAADLKTELEKKIVKLYFQKETSVLSINEIMGVSSKKFDVLESIRSLELRQIISKQEDGNYKLMR